jgi:hypothetical protein
MGKILASATTTTSNDEVFYQLPIPVTITVENSPTQPNLAIQSPVMDGLSSSVTFAINGISTNAIIDKDITLYFSVSGAAASNYTVTGAGVTRVKTLPGGSVVYSDTIIGSHNHNDSPTASASATMSITYIGSTPTPLTVALVPGDKKHPGAYYDGETYGRSYDSSGKSSSYYPPSQPLIGTNGLSQTINFSSPMVSDTTKLTSASEAGGGSSPDLLGRFDSQFLRPAPETHNSILALNSWPHSVSSAETYASDLAYRYDGNRGGERDAWGVAVGWNGSIGHGPGPGS